MAECAAVEERRITRPALRYHGGKFRLAPWIIDHFPPHRIYVEPFGGAAGVLLRKPRSHGEVYNDLDGDVVNFFRVLRDAASRERLIEACLLTPYARADFELAWEPSDDAIERARRTAVRSMMGFGSAGATKGSTGFRTDTKRAYSTAQFDWTQYPRNLAAVGERLSGVLIENRPAIEVMRQHDDQSVLHFVDPPYVHSTRATRNTGLRGAYRHEMTDDNHAELLQELQELQGMVVLSGYPSGIYAGLLSGWHCVTTQARISAGRGTGLRTEALWLNPACCQALAGQHGLFSEEAIT
ncbi:DNA adenine methylase [Leptospira sp. 96542]|nr:DNA adenine methylase [Leptospira sp. 96542]